MDLKQILAAIAPWIGTALGGPLGGMAVSTVADIFGLSEKTEDAIKTAISGANPEQMLALKNADQQFAVKMQELGFANLQALEQIAANDRASARQSNVESGQQRNVFFLTLAIIASVLTIEGLVLFYGLPKGASPELFGRILGTMDSAMMAAIFYTYGTNASSARKTELLSQSTPSK